MFGFKKIAMPTAAQALPGRDHADPHRGRRTSSIITR